MFYQAGPTDHFTNVTRPFAQSIAEIEYNEAYTALFGIYQFSVLNIELLN